MHPSTLLALIAPLASASTFTSQALRSGSDIHFVSLEARGQSIYVGGKTQSYCPHDVVKDCPKGNVTAFNVASGAGAMDVEVPGGQLLYVTQEGALGYTQAHSGAVPNNSYTTGFQYVTDGINKGIDSWKFTGAGATTFLACPVAKGGSYKVYADVTGYKQNSKCLSFSASAAPFKGVAAWQYT